MPRQLVVKLAFWRAYRHFPIPQQQLVDEALQKFLHYLQTNEAPVGLGIKHLVGRTFEFRVGLSLRVVYVMTAETVALSLLGSHDEVRRFLKRQ